MIHKREKLPQGKQHLQRLVVGNAIDAPDFRGKGSSASETIGAVLIFVLMIAVGVLALLFAPQ